MCSHLCGILNPNSFHGNPPFLGKNWGSKYTKWECIGVHLVKILKVLGPTDTLLIAGKGHEKTQSVGGQVLPFDDVEVASSLLGDVA